LCDLPTPTPPPTGNYFQYRADPNEKKLEFDAPPTEGWKMKLADLLVRFGVAVEYPHLEKAIWDFTTQALAEQKALHDKHCKEQYDLGHAHGVEIERARMVEVVANAPTFTKHVYALTGKGVEDTVYVDRDFIIKALSK